jgi:hypothetical protein
MRKIKNRLKVTALVLLSVVPVIGFSKALASTTATVSATVTPQNISVTVSSGTVAYGTLDLSVTKDTTSGGLDNTQQATNAGNVAEDFNITSTNATGGTGWTLAGTIGSDQFKHSFCTAGSGSPDPCDTSPTWNDITTAGGYQALGSNITASGTKRFDLKLSTPSATTDYVQKTITVTVQAVIH